MSWGAIVVGVVSIGATMWSNHKNREAAEELATNASSEQAAQQARLDKEKQAYKNMKFKNPYENMENVYEDLTVNQKQAEFQAQQGAQQRANILQGLRGAAGGSGIAGLAQSLANQGQLQTQRISASIGQQEARNQALIAKGAYQAEMAERGGEQMKQKFEMDRQATLLGMQYGAAAGANMAATQAQQHEMYVDAASNQALASSIGTAASNIVPAVQEYNKKRTTDPNNLDLGTPPTGTTIQTDEYGNQVSVAPGYDVYGNWTGNPLDDPNLNIGEGDLPINTGS